MSGVVVCASAVVVGSWGTVILFMGLEGRVDDGAEVATGCKSTAGVVSDCLVTSDVNSLSSSHNKWSKSSVAVGLSVGTNCGQFSRCN